MQEHLLWKHCTATPSPTVIQPTNAAGRKPSGTKVPVRNQVQRWSAPVVSPENGEIRLQHLQMAAQPHAEPCK